MEELDPKELAGTEVNVVMVTGNKERFFGVGIFWTHDGINCTVLGNNWYIEFPVASGKIERISRQATIYVGEV